MPASAAPHSAEHFTLRNTNANVNGRAGHVKGRGGRAEPATDVVRCAQSASLWSPRARRSREVSAEATSGQMGDDEHHDRDDAERVDRARRPGSLPLVAARITRDSEGRGWRVARMSARARTRCSRRCARSASGPPVRRQHRGSRRDFATGIPAALDDHTSVETPRRATPAGNRRRGSDSGCTLRILVRDDHHECYRGARRQTPSLPDRISSGSESEPILRRLKRGPSA